MRLRTLETNAGTVLVLDQAPEEFIDVAPLTLTDPWAGCEGAPLVMAFKDAVEIPESDNYHPPRDAKPDNPLVESLRRRGVSL